MTTDDLSILFGEVMADYKEGDIVFDGDKLMMCLEEGKPLVPTELKETNPSTFSKEKTIENGYVDCDRCNGTGNDNRDAGSARFPNKQICQKCWGHGKITWLEQLFGKQPANQGNSGSFGTSGTSGSSGVTGLSGKSGPSGTTFSNCIITSGQKIGWYSTNSFPTSN